MKSLNAVRVFRRSDAYVLAERALRARSAAEADPSWVGLLAAPGVTQLVDGAVRLVDCDVDEGH